MAEDLTQLGAADAAARIRAGTLTAETLARACLERVTARDTDVRAWSYVDADHVLAQARELDRAGARGPLHGVPVGIKDVILTRDMPTQYNSAIYRAYAPPVDAACVALLRSAGAVIFGKTDTVEFAATGRRALTRNPHRLDHTPGGSSSGSGAAVADFHVPLALGTQTGGSMIRPASYCGVYGIKPTWGLVNREGAKMFANTLDTIGWFARSAADLALLYDVYDPEPGTAPPLQLKSARIALYRSPVWAQADADTQAALLDAAERLRQAGAEVVELELPPAFDELVELQLLVMLAEGRSAFLADYRDHYEAMHPSFKAMAENAAGYTRAQLCRAYDVAAACRATFDQVTAEYDAVLTPSTVGAAPAGLVDTGPMTFCAMWSLLHMPTVNVPGLRAANGLPLGLTVAGPRFADRRVIAAAAAIGALLAPD